MSDGEPGRERVVAGRYRLLSPLGEGGMGTVWRARDEVLRREVAVKEVRAPDWLTAPERERMYARLEREAWAAARVAHPNVVTVYDVAAEDGRPWIVMELVRGLTLADLLDAEGPLPPRRAAAIGAEVLSALRAAHAAGVLHRDVKPGNVLMANDGRVVLTDFGIARVEGSSALTMTGEVIGSPEFLAPERALGRDPGPESDLWSLGVLLYAAVEGASPFRQDTPLSTLRAVVDEALPPPRRAGPLAPVIEGLLRKDPAGRPPAERVEGDLRAIGSGDPPGAGGPAHSPTLAAVPGFGPPPPTAGHEGTAPTAAAPSPSPSPASPSPAPPPRRERRTVLVLVTGIVVLVLALAGLTYGLLHRDGDDPDAKGSGATRRAETGGGSTARESTAESGDGAAPSHRRSTSSAAPAQSVKVTISGGHPYSGACEEGRHTLDLRVDITVGRAPATVEYRWNSRGGPVSDWRTRSVALGARSVRVADSLAVRPTGSGNRVWAEVRSPVHTTSNSLPLSVTCTSATPSTSAPEATPTSSYG
ncbi:MULTISPECIES: serine/threonine-protein kinase [Streptomyces]|uniref:serine/threonine-protein kinase n=1 Tax=Streptomyces griseoaurantiacus TaxID=68213 RepID=UPI002E316B54|nr:serine/threonine-protein kinase [Streptomyces jietaisiensis]